MIFRPVLALRPSARRRSRAALAPVALVLLVLAASAAVAPAAPATAAAPPLRLPAAPRVVAMGDWHGDLDAARRALRLAGAIDAQDRWIGDDLVVVQTGDQLDRGDQERAILDLLERLAAEAEAADGAVHALLGNHELMNVAGDFRYVTPGGWADFADTGSASEPADSALAALPPAQRPRAAAFAPGGQYARRLAAHPVVLIIGRTAFVHGGLLPAHLEYGLERLNRETAAWLRGEGPEPAIYQQRDDPVWARHFSDEPDAGDCALLASVLADLDCDRLVVGHTVQDGGIAPHCDGRVWCIDTGAAAHYGGTVQVLEITPAGVRALW